MWLDVHDLKILFFMGLREALFGKQAIFFENLFFGREFVTPTFLAL
jgi:hypothetical protein